MKRSKRRPVEAAMQTCKDLRREYQRIWQATLDNGSTGRDAYYVAGELNPRIHEAYRNLSLFLPSLFELRAGDVNELEKVLEFSETDVLAFRCGYLKSRYCNILKSIPLHPIYSKRVRNLAKLYVQWPGFRAEFREVSRLAIGHADANFVQEMDEIHDHSDDAATKKKSHELLYRILNSRPYLRTVVELAKYQIAPYPWMRKTKL